MAHRIKMSRENRAKQFMPFDALRSCSECDCFSQNVIENPFWPEYNKNNQEIENRLEKELQRIEMLE